ncbi:hypothetical protein [Rhodococcus sp. IEGM 1302]|nr:hypothetical protein [Rhodococcus sp. IEGM 1302]MDI9943265.1 hypothetical protein [Rhodococcus sp. IEGM 1302]
MTAAAIDTHELTVVAWTVPEHPLPGVTWYQPGERFNPDNGNPVLFTM